MPDIDLKYAKRTIQELVDRFASNQSEYESKEYLESQLRTDFVDELFKALGWDIVNKNKLSRLQREVLVEKGDTTGRPDYSFRVNGQDRFFVETKASSKGTDKPEDIFQAKSYGWNTTSVNIVVLTDFKSFKVFDTTIKPDLKQPLLGLIFELKFEKFGTTDFGQLWLFSKEKVVSGSLDQLSSKDPAAKRLRIPVDTALIDQMTLWREDLAKDVYKHNPEKTAKELNDVVQRLLDRIVFIRLLEDRKIIDSRTLKEIVDTWKEGRHRDIQTQLNLLFRELNNDFNGEIFKDHPCEKIFYDSSVVAQIIDELYYPKSPYNFAVIGVELLGTIYEKYLGKTIRLTEKRVKVEEKPEVRKAGGVYYTPKWVTNYIAEKTIDKLIEGKSPKQIESIHILDPACGSGSFLIEAVDHLFEYHLKYYESYQREAKRGELFSNVVVSYDEDGNPIPRLSIYKKGEILKNNIFGVDLDPQAVEITMMSLYIKILEGERALPHNKELLPSLSKNIRCGNSVIGMDFFDQKTLTEEAEREKINAFEWRSKKTGFGGLVGETGGFNAIIGNPPYYDVRTLDSVQQEYFKNSSRWKEVYTRQSNIFYYFIINSVNLLKDNGLLSFITSRYWLEATDANKLREFILENCQIISIVDFRDIQVFKGVGIHTLIHVFKKGDFSNNDLIEVKIIDSDTLSKTGKNIEMELKNGHIPLIYKNQNELSSDSWIFLKENQDSLFKKVKERGEKLNRIFHVGTGIQTGRDSVFVVDEEIVNRYKLEKAGLKKWIKNGQIQKYFLEPSNLFVIDGRNDHDISKFKNILQYIEDNRSQLKTRYEYIKGKCKLHEWSTVREIKLLDIGKKIICPYKADTNRFFLLENEAYFSKDVYQLVKLPNVSEEYEYFLGLLNSKLLEFYFLNFAKKMGRIREFYAEQLLCLPLKRINPQSPTEVSVYEKIVALVKKINTLNTQGNKKDETLNREIRVYEERIDKLVYSLYGLTDKEKQIIDNCP